MASQPSREDPAILLGVLSAVERDSDVTQRSISSELGIALGLANAYVGRCVRKGLIKVGQAPLKRYAYYLTPQGFAEKSRLTAEYLTVSLNFFRNARRECTELLSACGEAGYARLALVGVGELAEIAILSATEGKVEVVCVIGPGPSGRRCAGRPILADLASAVVWAEPNGGIDAVVITDVKTPQATFQKILGQARRLGLGPDHIVTPPCLRITRGATILADARL